MKKMIAIVMVIVIISRVPVFGEESHELNIDSKSCVLMESSTGMVLYENNQNEKLSPASITKIMTLVLIFDAIHSGKIKLTDVATTSAYAKSMGGSQVFLEEGETQTVETLIKCIIIASGNDASVVMAEMIAGSEEAFVKKMNERAKSLGMNNTHFIDCCGLTDSDDHYTTAYDLYLIFSEFIKHDLAYLIDSLTSYDFTYTDANGETRSVTLEATNGYISGEFQFPEGYSLGSWKSGTTTAAGNCLILEFVKDDTGDKYIAVIAGAEDRSTLYNDMTMLINTAK